MKPYYQDDAVTIYHGDAWAVRANDIGAYNAAALITDPPYGIAAYRLVPVSPSVDPEAER